MGAVGMESDACAQVAAPTHNSTPSEDGSGCGHDVADALLTRNAEQPRRYPEVAADAEDSARVKSDHAYRDGDRALNAPGELQRQTSQEPADDDSSSLYNSWRFWKEPLLEIELVDDICGDDVWRGLLSSCEEVVEVEPGGSEALVKRWWVESHATAHDDQLPTKPQEQLRGAWHGAARDAELRDVRLNGDDEDALSKAIVVIDPRAAALPPPPLPPAENSFASIIHNLRPISSFFKSFRRIYRSADDGRAMGNLQGSDGKARGGGKSPGKARKNKEATRKSPAKEPAKRTAPQPPQAPPQPRRGEADNGAPRPPAYLVTDSWRRANTQLAARDQLTPTSRESSSESVFTDPLTPHSGHLSDPGDMVSGQPAAVDDVTLTLVEEPSTEGSEASSVVAAADGRSQSHNLDALDEEAVPGGDDDDDEARGRSRSADALEAADVPGPRPAASFTVVRHRKVELNPTRLSEHCLTSGLAPAHPEDKEARDLRRHSSVSDAPLDSNVLRKVASLTLDKATLEQKVARPRFVPEKLDFQIYEKFEGQMLINWFVSSFADDHYLRLILTSQDLRILAVQFCTHLLAAGVLHQIPDKDVPLETMFRPDLMYYWAHTEAPTAVPATPGRLSQLSWPPTSPGLPDLSAILPASRPGAKYTEADQPSDDVSPCTPNNNENAKEIGNGEFQQVVMGMKREHKENLNRLSQNQEVNLFNFRGEMAQKLNEKDEKILQLELEIKKLLQELERYKTLADIQSLTAHAAADFGSPTAEQKGFLLEAQKTSVKQTSKEELHTTSFAKATEALPKVVKVDVATDTADLPGVRNTNVSTSPMSPKTKLTISTQTSVQDGVSCKQYPTVPSKHSLEINQDDAEHKLTSPPHAAEMEDETCHEQVIVEESLPSVALKHLQRSELGTAPLIVPDKSPPPPTQELGRLPPVPVSSISLPPPPPPVPSMGPPPPPLPSIGPPPPSMSSMGPPPPPMPGMGPPPPPMPGMGPPPPPMPGMGPPPPPMPGMGPPPPPMPGMGPPPPPMPGMGPPPPPMPGMGPPPPQMSGMGPPLPPPPPGTGASGPPPPPPPVPGMSPMPFPAPPVGGWAANRAMLRKMPLTPPVPMKPLYWTRIVVPATAELSADTTDSSALKTETSLLWEKLEEEKIEDMKEFEELFSRQVVERKQTKKKEEKPVKQQAVKILDSKRSQSVGILASSLHVEFSEIENAIYNFDTSTVNLEALQQIYDVRATEEELAAIRNHASTLPEVPLDKPEQFLYELAEIPMFAFRISCFMFQSQFDDGISSVESKLNNLKLTCEFLTSSESLKVVLGIILALGNYMNGGNRTRGQADGFGLEILAKLKDVKSKDSSVTLLHFIVRTYIKKTCDNANLDPNLALPIPEPGDIDRAGSVNFEDLKNDLEKLKTELKTCEAKTEKVIGASNEDNLQPFKEKMETFLKRANNQLAGEFAHLKECKEKFIAAMEFYQYQPKGGIKPDELDPKEFFASWSQFCTDFKDIWKKEQQRIIKEKTQQVKRLQEQRRDVKKSKLDEKGLKVKLQRKFK